MNAHPRMRRKRIGVAGLVLGLAASVVPLLSASPASATPGTNHQVRATTPYQTNVDANGPLAGLKSADTINVTVTQASAGDPIFGINEARLCEGGSTVTNSADMSPSDSGQCLDAPLAAGTQAVVGSVGKDPSSDHVDFAFIVGTGSRTVNFDNGSPQTNDITCDATSPCRLWIDIARSGGSDFVYYDLTFLGTPGAPTAATSPTCATVTWTPSANTGNSALATFTATATSSDGGAAPAPVVVNEPTHSATFAGLTPFKHYTATVTATNAGGNTSPASAPVAVTTDGCVAAPVQADPTVAAPNVTIGWSTAGLAPGFDGFDIVLTPSGGAALPAIHVAAPATSKVVTGLSNGVVYDSVVYATYNAGADRSAPSNAKSFVIVNTALVKTITVVRPAGALVLTQLCAGGTAPKVDFGSGPVDDPLAADYPYPQDPATGASLANYPSTCGINMGAGKLIKSGPNAGQFFEASAPLGDISIVDTRDVGNGDGWTVNGKMADFVNATGDVIDADELGWTPARVSDSAPITFSDGTTYDQVLVPGAAVLPNQGNGTGLSAGKQLASALEASRLGIAKANAGLTLWIPVTARNGTYTGVLTLTAI